MDDEHLILLVQENECLYNKYCPSFKLAEKKKNVWRQISTEMQIPEDMCMKRWSCLRDRYAREKRLENAPSGSSFKSKSQWPLMQTMEFIAPHIVPRAMRCSYNITEEGSINFDISQPSPTSSQSPISIPSPLPETSNTQSSFRPILPSPISAAMPKRRRVEEKDEDSGFSEALGAFKALCESKMQKDKEEEKDPLHGFGKMIVATIATMTQTKQIRAMQKLTSLAMEIKLEPDE